MTYHITTTYPLKKQQFIRTTTKPKVSYKLDHDPKEDDWTNHWDPKDEGPVEIYDPEPEPKEIEDHTHYDMSSTIKTKIKYNLAHNIDDIDERGVIEIPATNDTVIYQDEDGQYYEIPTSDLIDYDGDDGEITYHSKSKNKKRVPKMYVNGLVQQRKQMLFNHMKSRVYA